MKLKHLASIFLFLILCHKTNAQVWYPEGVYTHNVPSMITVDNQLISISRAGSDLGNSYWQVSINEGSNWKKLPLLTLNKGAEILDIKKYAGQIFVAGNFTFDNAAYNALVKFNGTNWQGLTLFKKPNTGLASILTLDIQKGNLILGGSFYTIGQDTIPYLGRFNGFKFSNYFDLCKTCAPDNTVIDIASNDSVVAFSGQFTSINNQYSKYIYRLKKSNVGDSFSNTPRLIEKIALDGNTIYGVSTVTSRSKRMYKISNTFTEINYNLDSAVVVSELVVYDSKLVLSGLFNLQGDVKRKFLVRLNGSTWQDIGNNFSEATCIAVGRSFLFASGNPKQNISVWNPNRFIVRFYPNAALLKAKVFLDSNNNCVQESNEPSLSKQYIKFQILNKAVFTNEKGMVEFLVPNSVQTTHRFVVKPFRNYIRSNCADTVVNRTFSPGVYLDSIQFPLTRVPNVNDIRISISSPKGKQVLKNKRVQYILSYENVGSNAISGSIKLHKSPLFSKEQTSPAFKSKINDSTLSWDYNNLLPGEKRFIGYVGYPENVYFDQAKQFSAKVSSSIASGNTAFIVDDTDSIPQEVNQNFKAFRKDIYPTPSLGDSITYLDKSERDLRYHISFNNFSNDTVFYAVVIDTLDINLDMSYIEETGSNKSYYTEVQTDPNNANRGILIWHFPNIKLTPNSTQDYESNSSGSYIGFKVVSKPLNNGYYLRNTASVFYDNQFAGNTNTVYCTLAPTNINELQNSKGMHVYPNPFNSVLEFAVKGGSELSVYDALGQLVYHAFVDADSENYSIDLSLLQNGLYIMQVGKAGQVLQAKLIKN